MGDSKMIKLKNILSEAIDKKKIKKEVSSALKNVRKSNFNIARELNKIDKNKAKKAMALYKKYIIEYQIRIDKLLRDVK
tara:strand:- start:264 stop:500 length:237 start_codon:yes stop_codon:yes gene_type:complete